MKGTVMVTWKARARKLRFVIFRTILMYIIDLVIVQSYILVLAEYVAINPFQILYNFRNFLHDLYTVKILSDLKINQNISVHIRFDTCLIGIRVSV